MNDVLRQLHLWGIVPVVRLDTPDDALPLAQALCDGGLRVAEITYRTSAAKESIERITSAFPDMLIGAGTVLSVEQAEEAVGVGARFIVSPGFNPKVVDWCVSNGVPITPGTANPTDIEAALGFGLDVLKFFPAEQLGGLKMIKALAAPYVGVKFMPTGGINSNNLNDYLTCGKIWACGGSWMVDPKLIAAGDFDAIRARTAEAVSTMLAFRFHHLGVNCADEGVCRSAAAAYSGTFGFANDEIPVSIFTGRNVEFMKNPGRGTVGHWAVQTNHVDRAIFHLKNRGVEFDEATYRPGKDGEGEFIYLKNEFAGYAVHLCLPD